MKKETKAKIRKAVGELILETISQYGMKRTALKKTKLSYTPIYNFFKGEKSPDPSTLPLLLTALHEELTPEEFNVMMEKLVKTTSRIKETDFLTRS